MIWLGVAVMVASCLFGAWALHRASQGQPSELERFEADLENLKREIGRALLPGFVRACERIREWRLP